MAVYSGKTSTVRSLADLDKFFKPASTKGNTMPSNQLSSDLNEAAQRSSPPDESMGAMAEFFKDFQKTTANLMENVTKAMASSAASLEAVSIFENRLNETEAATNATIDELKASLDKMAEDIKSAKPAAVKPSTLDKANDWLYKAGAVAGLLSAVYVGSQIIRDRKTAE